MFKHANRGALPAMLVLGVLIGASLAVASPSRPNGVLPSAGPRVVAAPVAPGDDGGTAGSPGGAAEPHGCARAIAALAHGDHGLTHAIARVLTKCKDNPQAPGFVNAQLHRPGNAGEGGESSEARAAGGHSRRDGTGSESDGSGGGDGRTGGADGGGSSGSGSTGGGEKDNNGKAKGHLDEKDNNGKAKGHLDEKDNNG